MWSLSLSPFPFSLSHTTWCVMQPGALNKYWPSSHQNRGSDTLFSRHYPVEEIPLEHGQISRAIIVCDHPARKGTWPVRHSVVFLWGNRTEQQAAESDISVRRMHTWISYMVRDTLSLSRPVPGTAALKGWVGGLQGELWAGLPDPLFISEALSSPSWVWASSPDGVQKVEQQAGELRGGFVPKQDSRKQCRVAPSISFYNHSWKDKSPSYSQVDRKR